MADLVAAAGLLGPNALAELLDGVLDHLLGADLTALTAEQHAALVSRLVRHQNAQHAAVLDAVAAFDAADVASTSRHVTTKRWLEHRTRVSPGTAAHMTRTARALRDHLPMTRNELARRTISAQHVGAIASVVNKVGVQHAVSAEPILIPLAREAEPSVVRRATARIHALVDPDGAERAFHDAYDRRGVTLSVVGDRGYLDGVLDVESAELLRSALQPLMTRAGESDRRSTPQLRADALLDIAQRALDAGDLPEMGGERPHLSVVVDEAALRERVGVVTLPWTSAAVPAEVARRWACDCDAHHVHHWAEGGATSLDNMVLLCRHHHRTLHASEWSLSPDPGQRGRFWATVNGWDKPAQTAADRSPPVEIETGSPPTRYVSTP